MLLREAVDLEELGLLARQWGVVYHEHVDVGTAHLFEDSPKLNARRRAEICYVMHGGDPAEGILLHTKGDYPLGAYRMPTGGVNRGELVKTTLIREIVEETGLVVQEGSDADFRVAVRIQALLGITSYTIHYRSSPETRTFATYHFLVQKPASVPLIPQDQEEDITGWKWLPPGQLPGLADELTSLRSFDQRWGDWGQFRAISHRFVYHRLAQLKS